MDTGSVVMEDLMLSTEPIPTIIVANSVDFSGNTYIGDLDGSAIESNPFLIGVSLVE